MKILTDLSGTTDSATWNQQAQQTVIVNRDNQQYPRTFTLSTQGVRIARLGVAVGFSIEDLIAAAILLEPTLSWPPIIAVQPVNVATFYGAPSSFSILATSELAFTYQWQVSTDGGASWFNATGGVYSGDTTNILSISASSSGLYRCIVSNGSGTTFSARAILSAIDPIITIPPESIIVTAPAGCVFSVAASGATTLHYQWQISTDNGVTFSNVTNAGVYTGATTDTLNISDSTGLNNNQYRAIVSDVAGSATSAAGTLGVL